MFGSAALATAGVVTTWVYEGGKWVAKTVKANKEQKARETAQVLAQIRKTNQAHWARVREVARAYQDEQIRRSPMPGNITQTGLAQDAANRAGSLGSFFQLKPMPGPGIILLGGALIYMAVRK